MILPDAPQLNRGPFSFWLVLVISTLGCASQQHQHYSYLDLQQQKEPPSKGPHTLLSAAEIKGDLDLMTYALDRGYGGRRFVPEKTWRQLTNRLNGLYGTSMTVERFCDEVADALWQVPDAHLSAQRQSQDSSSNTKCGTLFKQQKRPATVGPNYAAAEKRKPWTVDFVRVGQATFGIITTFGIIAIKSFPQHTDPIWNGFDDAVEALLKTDGILIDMRGNGGGDDSRGYQLARKLIDSPVWSRTVHVYERQTPETITLWLNTLDRVGRQTDGTLTPHLVPKYEETRRWREQAAASSLPESKVENVRPFSLKLGPQAFSGPVAVLVDSECASSCESSLEVIRYYPKAKVFGQRTAGFVHFGNVGSLSLPNSGIRLRIPTKYNEYPSGQFYDKVGFEPDVNVDGSNVFNLATRWLREQVGNR